MQSGGQQSGDSEEALQLDMRRMARMRANKARRRAAAAAAAAAARESGAMEDERKSCSTRAQDERTRRRDDVARDDDGRWLAWRVAAEPHAPARSGRHGEQADNRGRGVAARVNAGIGRGRAEGTELAQQDFRRNTTVCSTPGCDALSDEHWNRRRSDELAGKCGWCLRRPKADRRAHLERQLRMASEVERGERRLVYYATGDRAVAMVWPADAVAAGTAAARYRAHGMLANPPKRGRPRKRTR